MSTTRRTAGVYSRARPLGPNGERICYQCGGPLPKGRTYNCSPECSEKWQMRTSPSWMRHHVFKRDKGICALCGLDTIALADALDWCLGHLESADFNALRFAIGVGSRYGGDLWDADHILPVIEGGGECDLDNLRTLCIPCHKKVTRDMHHRHKRARIEARPLPLFD